MNSTNQKAARLIAFMNAYTQGMSGGDKRFIEIAKRLRDFDITVITSELGKQHCKENGLDADYIVTNSEKNIGNLVLLYLKRIVLTLNLKLKLKEGDILYSTSDFLPDVSPPFVWKLRNKNVKWIVCIFLIVPTLFKDYTKRFTENSCFSMPNINRFFYFFGQGLTIFLAKRWADQILVLNKLDKEYLVKKRGIDGSLISVVHGGINYNHLIRLQPKNINIYDGVFLARFHPQKGIFDLIKIWKLVCEKKPKAKLCIIGDGPKSFVKKVKMFIKENNLINNIELVGSKFGDEKFSLLKYSKIFLWPSYYESFAIVIAEAMACGLPVVTYDLPIYEDIYEKNILKVPIGDINQFAEMVVSLLNDEKYQKDFGLKGQKFIQKYDWDMIAEKELELIKEVVK